MADTTRVTKNASGGRYKYADMSQIHGWLEDNNITYYQYIERIEGDDYIYTVPIIDGKELPPRRGCRVVDATLVGVKNPAQEQGSAITYARRYSLLMAFGLATEDDDAQCLSRPKDSKINDSKPQEEQQVFPDPRFITPDQRQAMKDKLAQKNIPEADFLKLIGIGDINSIPSDQVEKILHKIDITPAWT